MCADERNKKSRRINSLLPHAAALPATCSARTFSWSFRSMDTQCLGSKQACAISCSPIASASYSANLRAQGACSMYGASSQRKVWRRR